MSYLVAIQKRLEGDSLRKNGMKSPTVTFLRVDREGKKYKYTRWISKNIATVFEDELQANIAAQRCAIQYLNFDISVIDKNKEYGKSNTVSEPEVIELSQVG